MNHHQQNREYLVKKYEEYRLKVAAWAKMIWQDAPDDDYEKSPDYAAALEFYQKFEQKDGVEYRGVIDYARQLYDRLDRTDKTLDEKADSIIKYLGGGSALVTFGAFISLRAENLWSAVLGIVTLCCLLPSLICAILAVRKAVHVRRPQSSATIPDVKFAVEMAEFHKTSERLDLNLWLIFHPVCEALYFRNLQKAKLVATAHRLYLWAIGFLLVPLVGIIICLGVAAAYAPTTARQQSAATSQASEPAATTARQKPAAAQRP
jgi:hypothetical protein